jgi:hypothetical protein
VYIKYQSFTIDCELITFTLVSLFSRSRALEWVCKKLKKLGVDEKTIEVSKRKSELFPYPVPGSKQVIKSRTKSV